jgi:head-tail adaptor
MRTGKLRNKITVVSPTSARAADGSIETVDSSLGTFYGSIRTDNMSEVNSKGKLVSFVKYTIHFRYNTTDLTALNGNARLLVDGRELVIVSASVKDHRDRTIVVTAEERV